MFVRYTYTHSHFRGIHGVIYCNKQLFSVYNVTFLIIFAIFFKMIGVNVILVNVTVTTGVVHHINYACVTLILHYTATNCGTIVFFEQHIAFYHFKPNKLRFVKCLACVQ